MELDEVVKRIENLESRVKRLELLISSTYVGGLPREKPILVRSRELPIPEVRYSNFTLRGKNITLKELYEIGTGTAEDISKRTDRSRSVEANYLNRLYEQGLAEKVMGKKKVYYRITDYGREFVENFIRG